MYVDPDGNFAISIFVASIIIGSFLGGTLRGYTASQNGAEFGSQEFWICTNCGISSVLLFTR
jgi:hypothetical protein